MNLYKNHITHKRFNSTDINTPSTNTPFPFIKPKKPIVTSAHDPTTNVISYTHSFSFTDNPNIRSSPMLSRSITDQRVDKIITEINTSHFLKKSLFKPKSKLQLNAVTNSHINFILGIQRNNIDTVNTPNTHNNLLSKQLSLIFNDKTHKILTNDKKNKYTYNNFRKKIMNDFSDSKDDDNHKHIIIKSKRNYKKFVKILDDKINENINHAKQVEMLFYQKKYKDMNYKCKSMWDIKTNTRCIKTKRNTSKDVSKLSNEKDFIRKNIKVPYTRIERNLLLKDKVNCNESITHSNTNVNNSNLPFANVSKLKELLYNNTTSYSSNRNMNKYSKHYQSNTEPSFIKKHFSKETIKRFRQYNGVFFGLPV